MSDEIWLFSGNENDLDTLRSIVMTWEDPKKNKPYKVYTVTVTIEENTMALRDDIPVRLGTREIISLATRQNSLLEALGTARTHLKVYEDNVMDAKCHYCHLGKEYGQIWDFTDGEVSVSAHTGCHMEARAEEESDKSDNRIDIDMADYPEFKMVQEEIVSGSTEGIAFSPVDDEDTTIDVDTLLTKYNELIEAINEFNDSARNV